MPVQQIRLRSTALASASYDDERQELVVTFNSGRRYTHPGVPSQVVEELASAPSAGSYYNNVIKGTYV